MENLYKSLFENIHSNWDEANSFNFELSTIAKISGHCDLNSISKYFNFVEYKYATEPLGNNFHNIIHINIRSLHKNFELFK